MRRTKEDAAMTRKSLLKAGLSVFSHKGFSSATLEDVAKEAGVTRGAIYWHFGSKADLYNTLLKEYSDRGDLIVQSAAAEGGTLVEILRRVFVRLLTAVETDPDLKDIMGISMFKAERTADLVASLEQQLESSQTMIRSLAAFMSRGSTVGELRPDLDPAEMARAFLALQTGTIFLWLQDSTSFSLEESAPILADIFLQGIIPRLGIENKLDNSIQ
jgi:AcrR family transcriptional regulator